MVLWLWFTRYIGGRPKFDFQTMPNSERLTSLLKKSRDRNDQVGGHWLTKSFFGYQFFYYDFLKFVKKSLLVDLLTFVAKKKNIMMYT